MTDYMFTVIGNAGARDVQVNNAPAMREAIKVAEVQTGCRVDHGRSGILPRFNPAMIIDYATGDIEVRHDHAANESMEIVNVFKEKVSVSKGEGKK